MNQRSAYVSLGLGLLLAFFLQHLFQIKWPLMVALQQHATYKYWSGLLLMTYITYQWYLAFLRMHGRVHAAKRHYKPHKWLGACAPLFFYVHSTQLGYAYLGVLSVMYFANVVLGLCNQEVVQSRKKWFTQSWMVTHVAASVLIVVLMVYHIFISFSYS